MPKLKIQPASTSCRTRLPERTPSGEGGCSRAPKLPTAAASRGTAGCHLMLPESSLSTSLRLTLTSQPEQCGKGETRRSGSRRRLLAGQLPGTTRPERAAGAARNAPRAGQVACGEDTNPRFRCQEVPQSRALRGPPAPPPARARRWREARGVRGSRRPLRGARCGLRAGQGPQGAGTHRGSGCGSLRAAAEPGASSPRAVPPGAPPCPGSAEPARRSSPGRRSRPRRP